MALLGVLSATQTGDELTNSTLPVEVRQQAPEQSTR